MKYHHGNLKEELISSACKICEASGHDHMSLRSIAKEANVSQTAPYRHFKTKECLLAEVSKRGFDELTERLRSATCLLYTSPSPRDMRRSRMPSSA